MRDVTFLFTTLAPLACARVSSLMRVVIDDSVLLRDGVANLLEDA